MEKIIERLKKIKELADRGDHGEAIAAKNKLEKGLARAGLTIEDLENTKRSKRVFKYFYGNEKNIIFQIIMKILNESSLDFHYYKNKKKIGIDLSDLEYYEVQNMISFYIPLYRKEIKAKTKALKAAFIHKHKLFPEKNDHKNKKGSLSKKEIEEILAMKDLLEDSKYHKQLKK